MQKPFSPWNSASRNKLNLLFPLIRFLSRSAGNLYLTYDESTVSLTSNSSNHFAFENLKSNVFNTLIKMPEKVSVDKSDMTIKKFPPENRFNVLNSQNENTASSRVFTQKFFWHSPKIPFKIVEFSLSIAQQKWLFPFQLKRQSCLPTL